MAEEAPEPVETFSEESKGDNGRSTTNDRKTIKRKASTSQIEKKCICPKPAKDLLCPIHGLKHLIRHEEEKKKNG